MANEIAKQGNELKRSEFRQRARELCTDYRMVLAIDETAKGQKEGRKRRAWGRRGKRINISKYWDPTRHKRYSMLAAMDKDGFVLS